MGLFDKFKKKAEQAVGQVSGDINKAAAQAPAQAQQAAGQVQQQVQAGAGLSDYEPTEWEHYYNQPDHWGNINYNDLDEFMLRYFTIEEAQGEGNVPQVFTGYGYRNQEEWAHVMCTFFRYHFGRGGQVAVDDVEVNMGDPTWTQAGYNARMKMQMMKQQAAAQANPQLLAPVEGVTVEQWAAASAQIAALASNPTAMAQALARLGMDKPKYDRVGAVFMQRMQGDTTGAISSIYGKAFSEAQGMAGGYGVGTVDGSAQKLGQEPVSMEKYAEINGAMDAWARQGADVNANLQSVFGLTPAELSKLGAYWSTKFAANVQLMQTYGDLLEKYSQKYSGPDLDDDLDKI